jgi:hypothetical protein
VNHACSSITSPSMKTVTLNGVPYSLNDKQELYMYGTSVCVGRLENKQIVFTEGWRSSGEAYMNQYRSELQGKTVAAMAKAKMQFEGTAGADA